MIRTITTLLLLSSLLTSVMPFASLSTLNIVSPVLAQGSDDTDTPFDSSDGTVFVSSTPAGADIYIDGARYLPAVSPATIKLPPGTYQIELKIPGYETYINNAVVVETGETTSLTNIVQLPALLPATVITVNHAADDDFDPSVTIATLGDQISLRRALTAIMNDSSDTHYRIEFAEDVSEISFAYGVNIWSRGNFTINGDKNRDGIADVSINSTSLFYEFSIAAAEIRIIGIKMIGMQAGADWTMSVGYPDQNTHPAFDVHNVYFLGNEFIESHHLGTGQNGAYGYAGTEYGGDNTFNVTNIVFAGNKFNRANLLSFAGAGDEDFNVIDGYYVVANEFINGETGILTADSHTWYVFGETSINGNGGVPGQIGFSEHNIVQNVQMSGNTFSLNENAPHAGTGGMFLITANMGNSYNTMKDVILRNNTVEVADPTDKNLFTTGISISNAIIGDENAFYTVPENSEFTSNNTLQNVTVAYNNAESGNGRGFAIVNNAIVGNPQNGSNNLSEQISFRNNLLKSNIGVWVMNYYGNNHAIQAENNLLRNVTIENNQIIADPVTALDWWDGGVTIAGAQERDYAPEYLGPDYFKAYGGLVSNIVVQNNTIENQKRGVLVTGSAGYQHDGIGVDTVLIKNNTITTKPSMSSYAIEITGATLDMIGIDLDNQDSFRNGSKNCFATNITVEANTVLSRGGISVSGAFVDDSYSASLAGNYVDGVILKDNNLFRLQNTEPDKQFLKFPIVIGGIFDTWNQAHNLSPDLLGNNVTNVNISGNMISGYDFQPLTLARDFLPNQQTLSSDQVLQWLKGTTDLASGINSFSWDWYSTPATNGTTDKYVAFGIAHLGSYPNLAFPGGIYVELEGDFANNPSLNYVFIPLLKK